MMTEKNDEHAGWGDFLDRHGNWARNVVRVLVRKLRPGHSETEDTYQETVLRVLAWSRIPPNASDDDRCRAFRRVAKNMLIDKHRQRNSVSLEMDPVKSTEGIATKLDRALEVERLRIAIESLPKQDQRLIARYYTEGLSPNDIATLLSISPATVRMRLFRARQRLASELRADDRKHG